MTRLWGTAGGSGEPRLEELISRLTVGRDPELDLELLRFDALASAAHARMLGAIGVLTEPELSGLLDELRTIASAAAPASPASENRFKIKRSEEDGHTAIENRLTAQLGEAGRKIHTGRSRNDQVIAALRLWGREAVLDLTGQLLALVETTAKLAAEHSETSIAGTTHTRQAMPSTLGHFFAANAEGLLDQMPWLRTVYEHLNRSPLGSASGFGVALNLDRELVARLLGFACVQVNTLAVQNDRGRTEALALSVAASIATDLGRLASDLIRYSAEELAYLSLGSETTTGSSIMPQKRNPDVLEIIRASAGRCRALHAEVTGIYGAVGLGYHRDLQLTKEPFLRGLPLATDCCAAMARVLETMTVDRERCRQGVLPATAATDAVYRSVADGQAFRKAYREVASDPAAAYPAASGEPAESWRARRHLGAPGDLDLSYLETRLAPARAWLEAQRAAIAEVWRGFESD